MVSKKPNECPACAERNANIAIWRRGISFGIQTGAATLSAFLTDLAWHFGAWALTCVFGTLTLVYLIAAIQVFFKEDAGGVKK